LVTETVKFVGAGKEIIKLVVKDVSRSLRDKRKGIHKVLDIG
jgi:hypothetical protein